MSSQALPSLPRRIVSGGQTGVDRAALDAAMAHGIEHGGWCPLGRLAEDGPIPARYQLRETDSTAYPVRTRQNVLDSDGTLILYCERLFGGTELTRRLADEAAKPRLLVDLAEQFDLEAVHGWLARHQLVCLNVAGPRESSAPGITQQARCFLDQLLDPPREPGERFPAAAAE